MENPLALATASVKAANMAFYVSHRPCRAPGQMGGADNDRVASDKRRGMQPDLASHRVEVLVHGLLEVDHAVGTKVVRAEAGGRVEHDELVAGCDVDDSPDPAVVPVGEASS